MITAAYELRPHFRNQLGFTPVGSLFSSVFLSVSLSILELDPTVTPKMAQFKDRVADKTPSAVLAFDLLVSGAFTDYLKASQILGGDVTEQAELVNQGIK